MESTLPSEEERTHLKWRGRRGRFGYRATEKTGEIERGRKEEEEEEREEDRETRRRQVKEELSRMLSSRGNGAGMPRSAKSPLAKNVRKKKRRSGGRESLIQSLDFARIGHSDYHHGNDAGNAHRGEGMEEEEGERERERERAEGGFRPLLLFIPLRLGQEKFNMEYKDAIKVMLFWQSLVFVIFRQFCKFSVGLVIFLWF